MGCSMPRKGGVYELGGLYRSRWPYMDGRFLYAKMGHVYGKHRIAAQNH